MVLCAAQIAATGLASGENRQACFSKHDLVWENTLTDWWGNGAFLGNGLLGAMIYADSDNPGALRWELGRTDVTAHYFLEGIDWCVPRLLVGDLLLKPAGTVTNLSMRLDIRNAEARGTVVTDRGTIEWRSLIPRDCHTVIVEVRATGGESVAGLTFRETWGVSPRIAESGTSADALASERLPPKPRRTEVDGLQTVLQPLTRQGAHAVAWRVVEKDAHHAVLYCSIEPSYSPTLTRAEDAKRALNRAVTVVNQACAADLDSVVAEHRQWWHAYMSKSHLELPDDPWWEKFDALQLYKFGSATRGDSAIVMDNLGPWMTQVAWPGAWWNLNVQLAYSPAYTANRLETGQSLIRGLNAAYAAGTLHRNAPEGMQHDAIYIGRATSTDLAGSQNSEAANLTWALHNYWKQWKYSMEEPVGRSLFPLLRDSVNYFLHVMVKGDDGQWHLPPMNSPEYDYDLHPDTNYALAAFRWGLQTLIELDDRFSLKSDLRPRWDAVLAKLVGFPTDENGLMVAADTPFSKGHRHYSHLLALYPFHLITPEQGDEARDLFRKSVDQWAGMEVLWGGYSCTGSSAMYAILGDGERAYLQLQKLTARLEPNTMYTEGKNPVIETPLSVVETINYMLLQSWGGIIRIFPAVPEKWANVSFGNLRTEGAFLVSATRRDGKTHEVSVKSLAGEPLHIRPGFSCAANAIRATIDDRPAALIPCGDDTFRIELKKGNTVELRPCASDALRTVGDAPAGT